MMMEYSGEELMVLDMVKEYLTQSILCTDEDYKPRGGVFIKSKGMPIIGDLIEINMLGKLLFIGEEVIALVNTNIYHDYEYRTKELMKVVIKVLDGAVINSFKFSLERKWYNGNSKRKFQNILFAGVIQKADYEILTDSYF